MQTKTVHFVPSGVQAISHSPRLVTTSVARALHYGFCGTNAHLPSLQCKILLGRRKSFLGLRVQGGGGME